VPPARQRNDPRQYDDLAAEWWRPRGPFAVLHWLAAARARALPPAGAPGAVLLDLACGGGLLAPHVAPLGYRHVGVDLSQESLRQARAHGVSPVRADVRALPVRDGTADVVVAGEVLEHVPGLESLVEELCRVLKPGGTLLLDTLADTWLAKLVVVTIGERLPGVPRGIHDPELFVDRGRLRRAAAAHGVTLDLTGLRPRATDCLSWLARRRPDVRMVPTRPTTVLFAGHGRKEEP
jgi:2-polyprenyl-6-hydroxyphenyl methylase / 3-demethylubiquinone-9 3-methyltransferase